MGCADCDWQVRNKTEAAERTNPLPIQEELDTNNDSPHVSPASEPVISSDSAQAPPASEPVASSDAAETTPTFSAHVSEVRCFQGFLSLPPQCAWRVVSAACAFAVIDLHSSLASGV
jgi:hypothetical protein